MIYVNRSDLLENGNGAPVHVSKQAPLASLLLCQGSSRILQLSQKEGPLWEPYFPCLSNEEINSENVLTDFMFLQSAIDSYHYSGFSSEL